MVDAHTEPTMIHFSFATQVPAEIQRLLVQMMIEAEEGRLRISECDLRMRLTISSVSPGVLEYGRIQETGLPMHRVSETRTLHLLRKLPDDAGAHRVFGAIEKAREAGLLRPWPRNDVAVLQVGDDVRVGGHLARVQWLWGQDTLDYLPWHAALGRGSHYEAILADGRRVPASNLVPGHKVVLDAAAADIVGLRRLRRVAESRWHSAAWASRWRADPSPSGQVAAFVAASRALSAIDAMMSEASLRRGGIHPPPGSERSRALRTRLRQLGRDLRRQDSMHASDGFRESLELSKTLRAERDEVRAALRGLESTHKRAA
jgi:hypothetical protein